MASGQPTTTDVPSAPEPPSPPPGRRVPDAVRRLAFLAPLHLNVALFGTILTPLLLDSHPVLLLALVPVQPVALLVAAKLPAAHFLLIVVTSRGLIYLGHHLLGRWYGTAAVRRLGHRRAAARRAERIWAKVGAPVLVVSPGWWCSVLAGATGMRVARFLPLVLTGVAVNAGLTALVAAAAAEPLTAAGEALREHAVPLTVGMAVVAVTAVLARRRLRRRARAAPDPAGAPRMR